jgi:hypothetical protein
VKRAADQERIRSILALHALLFGEGLFEADSAVSGADAVLMDGAGDLDSYGIRSVQSLLAQYGILFGGRQGEALKSEAQAVTDVARLIDSLYAAPPEAARPVPARAAVRGPTGEKAFRLEDYGRAVEGPESWPDDLRSADSVCAFRTDAFSRYTILMLVPALSSRPDVGSMGERTLLLGGRVAYLVFEPGSYRDHYREFFLRDGGQAAPFRFEEMREYSTPRHDRFYIPLREAPPFPVRVPLDDELSGAYLVRDDGSGATLRDFLYRFLNSRTRLPFTALRRPVADLIELRSPPSGSDTRS